MTSCLVFGLIAFGWWVSLPAGAGIGAELTSLTQQIGEQNLSIPASMGPLLNGLGRGNFADAGLSGNFDLGAMIQQWIPEANQNGLGPAASALTRILFVSMLNTNVAGNYGVNMLGSTASTFIDYLASLMHNIAIDLSLLLFILAIWRYWSQNTIRGFHGHSHSAVGRLIFTIALVLIWDRIYSYELLISNQMIAALYPATVNDAAVFLNGVQAAIQDVIGAASVGIVSFFAPIIGAAVGGSFGGVPGVIIGGAVGELGGFIGQLIFFFVALVLIVELIYIIILKAIQEILLICQYVFGSLFLIFFASPDTEYVAIGFFRSFVEVSLWSFVWIALLRIFVLLLQAPGQGQFLLIIGLLQIMIQVPAFLARAQISPVSDFINPSRTIGALQKGMGIIGGAVNTLAKYKQSGGSADLPTSQKVATGNYSYKASEHPVYQKLWDTYMSTTKHGPATGVNGEDGKGPSVSPKKKDPPSGGSGNIMSTSPELNSENKGETGRPAPPYKRVLIVRNPDGSPGPGLTEEDARKLTHLRAIGDAAGYAAEVTKIQARMDLQKQGTRASSEAQSDTEALARRTSDDPFEPNNVTQGRMVTPQLQAAVTADSAAPKPNHENEPPSRAATKPSAVPETDPPSLGSKPVGSADDRSRVTSQRLTTAEQQGESPNESGPTQGTPPPKQQGATYAGAQVPSSKPPEMSNNDQMNSQSQGSGPGINFASLPKPVQEHLKQLAPTAFPDAEGMVPNTHPDSLGKLIMSMFASTGYIDVPGATTAKSLRMGDIPLVPDEKGNSIEVNSKGVSQVRVHPNASNEDVAMMTIVAGLVDFGMNDPAGVNAGRIALRKSRGDEPQTAEDKLFAALQYSNDGTLYQNTPRGRNQVALGIPQQMVEGARAWMQRDDKNANAFTEYLNQRYGPMTEEKQARMIHNLANVDSPDSGFNPDRDLTARLVAMGSGINSGKRGLNANEAVRGMVGRAQLNAINASEEYMNALIRDQYGIDAVATPDIANVAAAGLGQRITTRELYAATAVAQISGISAAGDVQLVRQVAALGDPANPGTFLKAYADLLRKALAEKEVQASEMEILQRELDGFNYLFDHEE